MRLDEVDLNLIDLLLSGRTARESADFLQRPLSTIPKRARLLIQSGALKPTFELGYSKLGVKKGFLHVYLADGNFQSVVDNSLSYDGVFSVGVHLGNSDVIGTFVLRDSHEIIDLMARTKNLEGMERIVRSEEVYSTHPRPQLTNVLKPSKFRKPSKYALKK